MKASKILQISIASLLAASTVPSVALAAETGRDNNDGRVDAQWTQSRTYHYTVVQKSLLSNDYTDTSHIIGSCRIRTNGGTCTISKGTSATRTIGVSLGADIKNIAPQLNMSYSTTQAINVGCTSDKLRAGQRWVAYAVGDRYRYKINKWYTLSGPDGGDYDLATSGWLYAFNPHANDISCGVG